MGLSSGNNIRIPDILLAAAAISILPSILWIVLGDQYFLAGLIPLSFFPAVFFSLAYLHINSSQVTFGQRKALEAEIGYGQWRFSFIKYDWVLLAYGIVFAVSFAILLLPYLMWWAFLPFHSVMVMAITIRRSHVKPPEIYWLRVAVSALLLLGGILWSFYVGSHFYLT